MAEFGEPPQLTASQATPPILDAGPSGDSAQPGTAASHHAGPQDIKTSAEISGLKELITLDSLPAQHLISSVIRGRRSVQPRQFNGRKVERQHVIEMLKAAHWAPSHRLTQPWRFVVIEGASKTAFEHLTIDLCRRALGRIVGALVGMHIALSLALLGLLVFVQLIPLEVSLALTYLSQHL